MTSGRLLPDSYLQPVAAPRRRDAGAATGALSYVCLWLFIFSIPGGEEVRIVGDLLAVSLAGMAAIGSALLHVIATWHIRKLAPLHRWMAVFAGWSILSLFWTIDWDSTAARAGTYIQLLVLVWLIWQATAGRFRVLGLLEAYVLGASTATVRALMNFASGETGAQLRQAEGHKAWEEARFTIQGINENDLGLMLALSIPMVFYILTRRKGIFYTIFGWAHLAACVIAILLTGSRAGLMSAGIGMLMLPLSFGRLPRFQKFPAIGACVAAGVGAAAMVPAETWRRLLSIGEQVSQGTMTHRTVIWAAGLQVFRDHPLLGVGSGAYGPAIVQAVDLNIVAHNTFLSILVELGVIGALVFLIFFIGMLYNVFRMPSLEARMWSVILLTWCVAVSSLTWEYRKPTWILFGLLVAHAYSRDWLDKPKPIRIAS